MGYTYCAKCFMPSSPSFFHLHTLWSCLSSRRLFLTSVYPLRRTLQKTPNPIIITLDSHYQSSCAGPSQLNRQTFSRRTSLAMMDHSPTHFLEPTMLPPILPAPHFGPFGV